jgi:nitrogen regulatory protein P-II 1
MIKIEALIRPQKLDDVKAALSDAGVSGMTVTDVRGSGKQKGYTQHYRGAEYTVNLLQKIKIEIVVSEELAHKTAEIIADAARTDSGGDYPVRIYTIGMGNLVVLQLGTMPETPSSIASARPPTPVETIALPYAIASRAATP